ncbi:two-component system sensor histidine kinase NtrB [Thalassorhabdomicrobium marinisediminis]|uniref:two-component system sensor histidine kinase NtrB n=1 Tax=Thalassorhabdomicrobium marinisediminis TaxID=2170577 RepID=UPI00248FE720|nr:ATP-binding protein [Thalassorhabdomicrobium marinisediminis]
MKTLWASLPVPALLLDPGAIIAESNPAAQSFFNLSSRALGGARLWDMIEVDAPLNAAYGRAEAQRSALFVNDVTLGGLAQADLQCAIQASPLQDSADQMLMLFTPRDMATRLIPSARSQRAARSAIGMAEMLAHEIKNPLAGITGAAQLLAMSLPPEDREMTDLIVAESRRIVTLLDRVEQFGNLTPPALRPVNIHDVLDRARQSASVGVAAHMTIRDRFDPSLPDALADPDQLLQVILNLLANAAEAGAKGGTITLQTSYEPSLRLHDGDKPAARVPLQIDVIDDGPGLPPDIAGDIFDPFVSGRENGTGLGLALVSKLISGMGGMVTVTSAPGQTRFRLSLAVAPKTGEI